MSSENLHDILDDALYAGFSVSKSQFERWKKEELIPPGRIEGLGYGLGSESNYPAGTTDLAIEIASALQEKRSFRYAAWKLWGLGYNIPQRIRRESRSALIDLENGLDTYLWESDPKRPRKLRREKTTEEQTLAETLGKERAAGAFRTLTKVMLGRISIQEMLNKETLQLFADGVGAGTDEIPDLQFVLPYLSMVVSPLSGLEALENATESDLIEIRDEALIPWRFLGARLGMSTQALPPPAFLIWLSIRKGEQPFTEELQQLLYSQEFEEMRDKIGQVLGKGSQVAARVRT